MFRVGPLKGNPPFGAEITGLDPPTLDDEGTRQKLRDVWIDRGVLVFKDMPDDRAVHVKLSEVFGETIRFPIPELVVADYPKLLTHKTSPENADINRVGGELRVGHIPWHTDLIFTHEINRGGILRLLEIPERMGTTGFIDQITAYERLDDDLKERIEHLHVIYQGIFDNSRKKFGFRDIENVQVSALGQAVNKRKFNKVAHPMVFRQPETGRKVLNVSPMFALHIEGMEGEEGDALLARVIEHIEADTDAYYHKYEPTDWVLWDNWRVLHTAYGIEVGARRTTERTTIKGDYGLGRIVEHIGDLATQAVNV